jgi:hypothetical protein
MLAVIRILGLHSEEMMSFEMEKRKGNDME